MNCHLDKYQATKNPNHAAVGYDTNCVNCHSTKTWLDAKFNHPAAFPLTNGHAGIQCTVCHTNGVFTGLTASCVSCHQAKYQATSNPNHTVVGYNTNCVNCHYKSQSRADGI